MVRKFSETTLELCIVTPEAFTYKDKILKALQSNVHTRVEILFSRALKLHQDVSIQLYTRRTLEEIAVQAGQRVSMQLMKRGLALIDHHIEQFALCNCFVVVINNCRNHPPDKLREVVKSVFSDTKAPQWILEFVTSKELQNFASILDEQAWDGILTTYEAQEQLLC